MRCYQRRHAALQRDPTRCDYMFDAKASVSTRPDYIVRPNQASTEMKRETAMKQQECKHVEVETAVFKLLRWPFSARALISHNVLKVIGTEMLLSLILYTSHQRHPLSQTPAFLRRTGIAIPVTQS